MTDNEIKKACGEMCGDNRFEIIEKYKKKLIEATNIETSKDEMAVIDNILFRFWQMKWLDKLDEFDRQKAEIERLQKSNDLITEACGKIAIAYKTAKSEAIKELLNVLELRVVCKQKTTAMGYESAIIDIKNLLKEMAGDDNA